MYLGLLYALEDMAVYGYITNTKIKFIVAVGITEQSLKDVEMRNVSGLSATNGRLTHCDQILTECLFLVTSL
jgi:hypothetical protein